MYKYKNPVIRGFNPDPSLCRVGDDFYLVTSTFEFFPGVPIYHSRNLVDWELINHCLTRDSQLQLEDCRNSGGIFAPTIRYHDGVFFMTTTNVTGDGNFIVHTKDIYGEWSEPAWIEHKGIDPSLLFDDDGKVYFCGTHQEEDGQCIAVFEIDPFTGEQLSELKIATYGTGGKFPEAPHIYKRNGFYYLMLAEGGTEYGHMETIFRSTSPYGPYEPCPHNPILSHKDFMGSPIQATGHADLVEDSRGDWWLMCLAIRPLPQAMLHNLGRETFLAPVTWNEEGWPIVGDNGRISLTMEAALPAPPKAIGQAASFQDHFDGDNLGLDWNYVRNPRLHEYCLASEPGFLKLAGGSQTLNDYHPTFVGVRQTEFDCNAETKMVGKFEQNGQRAGLTAFYNMDYHYEICLLNEDGTHYVALVKKVHDIEHVAEKRPIEYDGSIEFKIEAGTEDYVFYYNLGDGWICLGSGKTAGLCTEGTMRMTFTGTYIGLFAERGEAFFDYFKMETS